MRPAGRHRAGDRTVGVVPPTVVSSAGGSARSLLFSRTHTRSQDHLLPPIRSVPADAQGRMSYRLVQGTLAAVFVLISVMALDAAAGPAGTARPRAVRLEPGVLQVAVSAARCAQQALPVSNRRLLTVIDYSRPSTTPRLWVIDLQTERVLFEELVAHGRGSGDNLTERFSNEPGSHASSLGLFLTGDTYVGTNGYSLRLQGLEQGVNNRASERAIVMHGAPYVRAGMESLGRLGRSWGCPAVRPAIARQLIDTIKGGTLVFAYYPDAHWLKDSRFVGACGTSPQAAG